jgi:NAD(P)-dependent dehydrogenase (short-subunit alcohol dehydrogenase family)
MEDLRGRVAVVTGAAGGMGRAFACRFAAEGMAVTLADVDQTGLQDAVAEIRATGAEAIGVRTDVRYGEEVQRLADRTIEAFGAVHVVCNNAGVEIGAPFADIPESAWRWVLDVNVMGVVHGCRVFLPLIRHAGEGHIVNTGSGASFSAVLPTFGPYVTSKFAVLGLTESLDMELRGNNENIGVSLLAPGPVRTRMSEAERNRPQDVPATASDSEHRQILDLIDEATGDVGIEPEEVADMIVDAIRSRRFYVLTHPDDPITAVRARLDAMQGGPALQPMTMAERFSMAERFTEGNEE